MNEKVIKLPELWTEVTWEKFLGFTKIIQNHEKVEEAKKEEEKLMKMNGRKISSQRILMSGLMSMAMD